MQLLIESHYFPCIEYFSALSHFEVVELEANENFQKQSYRNRCEIIGPNNVLMLSVPVKKASKLKTMEVEIDHNQDWQKNHWRSITTSYNRSPFFEYYRDDLEAILFTRFTYLIELNEAILTYCLRAMGIATKVVRSKTYQKEVEGGDSIDLRGIIEAKQSYALRDDFNPVPYYQVFGKTFVPNLSIMDLLFSEGPLSEGIIKRSSRKMNN